MILTPTSTGNGLAGVVLGIFTWSIFQKADKIPLLKRVATTKRKESAFAWVDKNKALTLLGLESVNFGIHGITNPNGVMFAAGNTLYNVIMLWGWLPLRQRRAQRQEISVVLKKRTA